MAAPWNRTTALSAIHRDAAGGAGDLTRMVRMEGLEPPRLAALGPKPSVSTNSTTSAGVRSVSVCYSVFAIGESVKPLPAPAARFVGLATLQVNRGL